jgi:hypothetical protein
MFQKTNQYKRNYDDDNDEDYDDNNNNTNLYA